MLIHVASSLHVLTGRPEVYVQLGNFIASSYLTINIIPKCWNKVIAPQIEEWAKSMDDVVFIKVDVDEAEDVAQHYNITAMPTFMLFKETKKVADLMGANVTKLEELINSNK
ncbi:trxA [Lepeophtheirus salmonis]|uniref:TrxA n=1 Tax=Lepeophtheirus salmonis TaxID=72036 RepID=A0A7R8H7Y3_LEPSM|nr:trxA [Lepeophtheirus salmonis]CAF2912590.1 trxA [Lepeophtheirus salmonis]